MRAHHLESVCGCVWLVYVCVSVGVRVCVCVCMWRNEACAAGAGCVRRISTFYCTWISNFQLAQFTHEINKLWQLMCPIHTHTHTYPYSIYVLHMSWYYCICSAELSKSARKMYKWMQFKVFFPKTKTQNNKKNRTSGRLLKYIYHRGILKTRYCFDNLQREKRKKKTNESIQAKHSYYSFQLLPIKFDFKNISRKLLNKFVLPNI